MDSPRRCDQCRSHMPAHMHRTRTGDDLLVCPMCANSPQPRWNTDRVGRLMNDADRVEFENREMEAFASISAARTGGLQRVAHGIGDLMAIRHCPRCGSGDVIASSNGSTSCSFCHLDFTVAVQPQFASMPQTVDGQPYDDPSSADTETTPASPVAEPAAAAPAAPGALGAPAKDAADPEAATKAKIDAATGGGDPADPAKPGDDPAKPKAKNPVPPQFQKKTLRMLALRYADEATRAQVLDDIRVENGLTRWSTP